MLKNLFRTAPKWQSPKSQKRIEALAGLDLANEKDQQILLRLAREDSEPAVRREAVRYLADLDVIAQIQKRDLEAVVREAATQRLQDLVTGRAPSALDLEQRLAGIRRILTPSLLVHIIKEADHVDLKLAAIAQLNDEMFLDDIARHSTIARLRLAAAERISTPALLEALAEASKHKDKNVYKAIRTRLDDSHQQAKDAQALRERREALCTSMEHHARSAMNPLYTAKAESLRQQWQEVGGPEDPELGERFETAFALAWKQINEVAAEAQREADAAQALEEMQQAVATLEATFAAWQGQDDFDVPALAATRKTQRLRWELATQLQSPRAALAERYAAVDSLLGRLEQMLVQWQRDGLIVEATLARLSHADDGELEQNRQALKGVLATYKEYALPLPALVARIPSLLHAGADQALPANGPDPDAAVQKQKLTTRLDQLAAALQDGHMRDANRLLRKAHEFAREHRLHDSRLSELGEQVQELRSWAGFAVQPKKEALVERMQALISHEMDPDDKADAIHALQEEWKALGVVDPAIEQPLWDRFKAAGDAAFEPCREHFAAQREVRAQNLEKREALCGRLEEYLADLPDDGTIIDWKQHELILRTARQEWQSHHPSDRHRTRPLQERFQRTLAALEQRLRALQDQREARKRELIRSTRELAGSSDLKAACDQAKAFQQEWKAIGPAHPRVDRKLWAEFRAACDTLFGRRDSEFKARQASRDANVQKAEALIAACDALLEPSGAAGHQTAMEIGESFAALELPRDRAQELRHRFQASRQRLDQARRDQAAGARREKQDSVIRAWEEKALAGTASGKAGQLLLDLEILLELPSPSALQAERKDRQMQRLQSRGLRKSDDEAGQLLAELLQTPPAKDEHLPECAERLRQILVKTGK
ncbi:MAG TPA: DUF349 domain-containing protein [Moraxellaceae bacterium]|nr:DUF349 domain-containing protein [Moraxellaceae bacterium]